MTWLRQGTVLFCLLGLSFNNTVALQWVKHLWDHANLFMGIDMGSSSHWGLIIAPGQVANGGNLGTFFDLL